MQKKKLIVIQRNTPFSKTEHLSARIVIEVVSGGNTIGEGRGEGDLDGKYSKDGIANAEVRSGAGVRVF